MKHQDYCCDDSTRQAHEQFSLQYQRGHGLGSLFRGLVGAAAPLLKKGAISLGKSFGRKLSKQVLN